MPRRQHKPSLQMKDWKILSKYLSVLLSQKSYINMLYIMKPYLSRTFLTLQFFLAHTWSCGPPVPNQWNTRDFPANIPASKNHRRSDNPRVQSRLMIVAGKNVWGNCPVKTNEQSITEIHKVENQKDPSFNMLWITAFFRTRSSQNL